MMNKGCIWHQSSLEVPAMQYITKNRNKGKQIGKSFINDYHQGNYNHQSGGKFLYRSWCYLNDNFTLLSKNYMVGSLKKGIMKELSISKKLSSSR